MMTSLRTASDRQNLADDVAARHKSPVPAVGAPRTVIVQNEVITLWNDLWSPVVSVAELTRCVVVRERPAVHVKSTGLQLHRVARLRDNAPDENPIRIDRV